RRIGASPHPRQAPLRKCRVCGLPRWIFAWQIPPGTAGAQDVEEGVDEEPQRPGARPATPCWSWEQRCELRPLGISQVTRIQDGYRHGRAWHATVSSLRDVVALRVLGVEVCRPMAGMIEDEWGRNKGGQHELTDVEDGILKHALIHAAANFASFLAFRGLVINESTF